MIKRNKKFIFKGKLTPSDKIEKWLLYIHNQESVRHQLYQFYNIIGSDEHISPETVFLILTKKGLILTNPKNLARYKEDLMSGLKPSCLEFGFTISESGYNILDNISSKLLLNKTSNQLKLDL